MIKKIMYFISIPLMFITLFSCVPNKNMVYFNQGNNEEIILANYEPIIKPDDLLFIHVTTSEQEASLPFAIQPLSKQMNIVYLEQQSYLVSEDGFIDFPGLGRLQVGGLKKSQVSNLIDNKLKPFLKDYNINIRIMNYNINVLGDVNRPGIIKVSTERITLTQALSMAGDLTVMAKRNNILIMREVGNKMTYNYVSLLDKNLVNSPFYYLQQNDVIYVEARRVKFDSTAIGSNVTTILSILSFAFTSYIFFTRL